MQLQSLRKGNKAQTFQVLQMKIFTVLQMCIEGRIIKTQHDQDQDYTDP